MLVVGRKDLFGGESIDQQPAGGREKVFGMHPINLLKVSAKSNPNAVAGAIAGIIRQNGPVELQVIGAGALNQAIKAIAIARGFVVSSGIELVCVPAFQDVLIDGENRTAIRLRVEDRTGASRDLPHLEVTFDPTVTLESSPAGPPSDA